MQLAHVVDRRKYAKVQRTRKPKGSGAEEISMCLPR